jgi:hypothetical protein
MIPSRRVFLRKSAAAVASSLAPSFMLGSCFRENRETLEIDFIGHEARYDYFARYFRKIRRAGLLNPGFRQAAESSSSAVFLDADAAIKATYAVFFMEQGRDILATYPLASGLEEYNSLKETMLKNDRKIAMVNPVMFYPGIIKLAGMVSLYADPLEELLISCHPQEVVPGFSVDGLTGGAQLLQEVISFVSGKFPVSLLAENDDRGRMARLTLDYGTFQAGIFLDPGQTGWTLEATGTDFRARVDHTGLLAVNNEVRPRVEPATLSWESAMIGNLEDFIQAVHNRTEPRISTLEGLSAIILNRAVKDSVEKGGRIRL